MGAARGRPYPRGPLLHTRPDQQLGVRGHNQPRLFFGVVVPQGGIGGGRASRRLGERSARWRAGDVAANQAELADDIQSSDVQLDSGAGAGQPQSGIREGIGGLCQRVIHKPDPGPTARRPADTERSVCHRPVQPRRSGGAAVGPVLNAPDVGAIGDFFGDRARMGEPRGAGAGGCEVRPLRRGARLGLMALAGDTQVFRHPGIRGKRHVSPAAMLSTARSVQRCTVICRNGCQDKPAAADRGKTKARPPPGLSLACPKAEKAEAIPAFP